MDVWCKALTHDSKHSEQWNSITPISSTTVWISLKQIHCKSTWKTVVPRPFLCSKLGLVSETTREWYIIVIVLPKPIESGI